MNTHTERLVALKPIPKLKAKVGDTITVGRRDAALLKAVKFARSTNDAEQLALEAAKVGTAKKKRQYRRRDMRAED